MISVDNFSKLPKPIQPYFVFLLASYCRKWSVYVHVLKAKGHTFLLNTPLWVYSSLRLPLLRIFCNHQELTLSTLPWFRTLFAEGARRQLNASHANRRCPQKDKVPITLRQNAPSMVHPSIRCHGLLHHT